MSLNESVVLFSTHNGADKQYEVKLTEQADGLWTVFAYNGRRGGTMTPQDKTKTPLPYQAAKKIYDATVRSKLNNHYHVGGAEATAYASITDALELTGISLHLPCPADESKVDSFINDSAYIGQQKFNGERRAAVVTEGSAYGSNKKGCKVELPLAIAK